MESRSTSAVHSVDVYLKLFGSDAIFLALVKKEPIERIKALRDSKMPLQMSKHVAAGGYLTVQDWDAFILAIQYGRVDVLDWLFKEQAAYAAKFKAKKQNVLACAIEAGNSTVLSWLVEHGYFNWDDVISLYIRQSRPAEKIADFFKRFGAQLVTAKTVESFFEFAERYILRLPDDPKIHQAQLAARQSYLGSLAALRGATQNKYVHRQFGALASYDEGTRKQADVIFQKHQLKSIPRAVKQKMPLAVMMYLYHEKGCQFELKSNNPESILWLAAEAGNLDLLKLLVEEFGYGCNLKSSEFLGNILFAALYAQQYQVVDWLLQQPGESKFYLFGESLLRADFNIVFSAFKVRTSHFLALSSDSLVKVLKHLHTGVTVNVNSNSKQEYVNFILQVLPLFAVHSKDETLFYALQKLDAQAAFNYQIEKLEKNITAEDDIKSYCERLIETSIRKDYETISGDEDGSGMPRYSYQQEIIDNREAMGRLAHEKLAEFKLQERQRQERKRTSEVSPVASRAKRQRGAASGGGVFGDRLGQAPNDQSNAGPMPLGRRTHSA